MSHLSPQIVGLLISVALLWMVVYVLRFADWTKNPNRKLILFLAFIFKLILIYQIEANATFLYQLMPVSIIVRVFCIGATFLSLILCLSYCLPYLDKKPTSSPLILFAPMTWAIASHMERFYQEKFILNLFEEEHPRWAQWASRALGLIFMLVILILAVGPLVFYFLGTFFLFLFGLVEFYRGLANGSGLYALFFIVLTVVLWWFYFQKVVKHRYLRAPQSPLPFKRKSTFFFLVFIFFYLFAIMPIKNTFHIIPLGELFTQIGNLNSDGLFENLIYVILVYEMPLAILNVLTSGKKPVNPLFD